MAIAAGAKLLRIAAATINFLVRSIAVRGGVERVIARQALEAATVIDLGERRRREGGRVRRFNITCCCVVSTSVWLDDQH